MAQQLSPLSVRDKDVVDSVGWCPCVAQTSRLADDGDLYADVLREYLVQPISSAEAQR